MPPLVAIPAPQQVGFLGDATAPGAFLRESRNFVLAGGFPARRPGYLVRRSQVSPGTYTERIPCNDLDGTQHAAVLLGAGLYRDGGSLTLLETLSVDPWAADINPLPSWVYAYGRTVLVNGTDFRVLIPEAGALMSKAPLPDPANPTLAVVAGGSMTTGTWFVRIRWYDGITGTFSGPNARTGTAGSVSLTSGNQSISVTRPAAPARATHWQIQLARTTDTPAGYEITYEPATSGFIPISTTAVTLTVNPASGARFQFRNDGALIVYRHSNPPPAHFVCFHRGRWFYASQEDTWLIFSDVGNPEHFFHDVDEPHAGFNSVQGDGIGHSVSGPCTGLFSNQYQLFYAQRGDIQVGEGSWAEVFSDAGLLIQRNARIAPLVSNGAGAVSGRWAAVDQEIYFVSPRGPSRIVDGRVEALLPRNLRPLWRARAWEVDHRIHVAYEPEQDLVLFSLISQSTGLKRPDFILAWSREVGAWCPPWTLRHAAMSLQYLQNQDGSKRGLRVVVGSWSGQQLELGAVDGDGWDGSSSDADGFLPSAVTSTSATKAGASWTPDQFAGFGVVLVSPQGDWVYRQVSSNTATTLSWEEAVPGFSTTWTVYLGGIPGVWHTAIADANDVVLRGVKLVLDDQPSRRGA